MMIIVILLFNISWAAEGGVEELNSKRLLLAADNKGPVKPGENLPVDNIMPRKNKQISIITALALDLSVPGGGHFYRGEYVTGALFAAIKSAGIFTTWYLYDKKRSAENDFKAEKRHGRLRASADGAGIRYDRASQYYTFSLISCFMAYFVSALVNYNGVIKIRENQYPTFEITTFIKNPGRPENILSLGYEYRI